MRKNVLLVLPDRQENNALLKNLETAYNVFVAGTREELFQLLAHISIHLVICRADLPQLDGWQLCAQLKLSPAYAHIPVILVANDHSIATGIKSLEAGEAPQEHKEDNFIKKLNSLIINNLHNQALHVDLLARWMHMSRPTLYRKVKTVTDCTPNELIHQARLKQAAELLESGSYRVFEIARMVGFQTQSSFGKAFIKQFRLTPTQYLQRKKTNL